MQGDIARVAKDPKVGDRVRLRGGQVDYVVQRVASGFVETERTETLRVPPFVSTTYPMLTPGAWGDLVTFGASTVESAP
jgi:hypothetical protein